jgi:hypothetical protein
MLGFLTKIKLVRDGIDGQALAPKEPSREGVAVTVKSRGASTRDGGAHASGDVDDLDDMVAWIEAGGRGPRLRWQSLEDFARRKTVP